jgi:hypothetical protein
MARVTAPNIFPNGSATPDPTELIKAINSPNPVANAIAARDYNNFATKPSTSIAVTVYNKFYHYQGTIADYKKLNVSFVRNKMDTATIVLKQTDPMVPVVMDCWQSTVPIVIETGYLRWSGRVEYVDYAYKDNNYDVTVYCSGDYQFLDKIMCWPDPFLPLQIQFPSRALFLGPAVTCIKTMIAENVFRLQSGLWEFVDNALSLDLDWESWFGTLLESNGNLEQMLMTPIVVVPTNPLTDTSPWVSINGRMDKISTLCEQVCEDYGLILTADLWLPGDPQPAGLFIPLSAPTIVVDCKDMSGVTGPSGTFLDGIVFDLVNLQNSILGDVLSPLLNPGNAYAPEGINIAPLLGLNFVTPWVLFTDHKRGGLTEFHIMPHHPLAYTIIGGGKSPQWVNDLINATLEWLIDSIEIAIGFTGIPDTLLDGTFDDVIMAFQQIEHFDRRVKMGPYGYPEFFQQTGASAYTLDEWFALQQALWDTRGYHGIIVSFNDGYPYTIGKDIFLGGLASFAATNLGITGANLYTDYVEKIEISDSPEERRKCQVMIGDGKSHESSIVKIQRQLNKFEEAFQIVTMSAN